MVTEAVKELVGMPKLPISRGLMETTKKTPKGYVGAAEVGPAIEELRGAEALAEQKVGESGVAIEEAKRQEKAKEAEKASTSNQVKDTKPSHSLSEYVGLYTNDAYGKFEIFQKGDSLFAKLKNQNWWMEQFHYDIFRPFDTNEGIDTADKSPIRFQFNTGLKGDIESDSLFNFEPSIPAPIKFKRTNATKDLTADDLKKYVSSFSLAGADIKTYLKENVLYVLVPGQPEYELVPVGNHKFDFKKVAGYAVTFEVNDKGELLSLTFVQPNGNFKAAKK